MKTPTLLNDIHALGLDDDAIIALLRCCELPAFDTPAACRWTPAQNSMRWTLPAPHSAALSNGEDIIFSVRDSGEGIAPEQLPHVFDRYWTQAENNPTGTGLGLYITQGIVQAHGGNIVAESELGRGSEFRFTVPRMIDASPT